MNISLFDVIGPIMIGPSSSHTAGAARIAIGAAQIFGKPIKHISFGLHGSFAETYMGHGTDIALVGGAIGIPPDDERLPLSFRIAEAQGISFDFYKVDLDNGYENSVKISFIGLNGNTLEVIGSSTGGGRIIITSVDKMKTSLSFEKPSVFIRQKDCKGIISEITAVFSQFNFNIAQMQLIRENRGKPACCIIETDVDVPNILLEKIRKLSDVISVVKLPTF